MVLPENFLNFRFNAVEWQGIVDLGRYGSKGYTSVVHSYSEVTLLGESEDAALCLIVYYVLVIYSVTVWEQYIKTNRWLKSIGLKAETEGIKNNSTGQETNHEKPSGKFLKKIEQTQQVECANEKLNQLNT